MKRLLHIASLVLAMAALAACVEKPGGTNPDTGENGNNGGGGTNPPATTAATANDIVITELAVLPDAANGFYSRIDFVEGSTFNPNREVIGYQADITRKYKVSFKSNAAGVKVGSDAQTSGESAHNFSQNVTFTFAALDGGTVTRTVKITNPTDKRSDLPLLVINTTGAAPIADKDTWVAGSYKLLPNGTSVTAFEGDLEVKGRGNSSWNYGVQTGKIPFNIKLKDKAKLLGMKSHKRWCMLANLPDRTLLRNRISLAVADIACDRGTSKIWNPTGRYCEVILNGRFMGQYLLTEHIRIDKDRVAITPQEPADGAVTDLTGGYLIELDLFYDEPVTNKFRPTRSDLPVMMKNPEGALPTQLAWITNRFNQIENLIYPKTPVLAEYGELIDVDSFIDVWIALEVTAPADCRRPGSIYMHKDCMADGVESKLCAGPVWDFDVNTFRNESDFRMAGWTTDEADYDLKHLRALWYYRLFKDPAFRALAKARWDEVYPRLRDEIPLLIDEQKTLIATSAGINWYLWTIPTDFGDNAYRDKSWADAAATLKTNYNARLNTLNTTLMPRLLTDYNGGTTPW